MFSRFLLSFSPQFINQNASFQIQSEDLYDTSNIIKLYKTFLVTLMP